MNTRSEKIAGMAKEIADEITGVLERATRCCPNCDYFDGSNETCKLVKPIPQRPPARIIAFGCDSYEENCPF